MKRLWSPTFDMTSVPDDVLASEHGRRNNLKRKTKGAGKGRPRSEDRCACGQFTKHTAQLRRHVCPDNVQDTRP